MACPKYGKQCGGLRDIFESEEFLKSLDNEQYIIINKARGILCANLCDSDEAYRNCPRIIEGLLSAQWPDDTKKGNSYGSYEEMNAHQIAQANSNNSEESERGAQ